MSHQATAWAIEQKAGSPSAKAALWSIANYANQHWLCWPRQELIAEESEQSVDTVQRRLAELSQRGLIRRLRMKRCGRRTADLIVLAPSPLFAASLDALAEHVPTGCEVVADDAPASEDMGGDAAAREPDIAVASARHAGDEIAQNRATANCGSVQDEKNAEERALGPSDAAADCGSVALPQPAAHATATVRQLNQPIKEPESPPNPPLQKSERPQEVAEEEKKDRSEHAARAETKACPSHELLIGFDAFWKPYPDHELMNREAALAEFARLSEADRRMALAASPLYAAHVARAKRKPVNAARWLRERRFAEYESGGGAARTGRRVFVPEGSASWKAWCNFCAVAFGGTAKIPAFWSVPGARGAQAPGDWPPGGEGWLVPFDRWLFVERGTPQFNRYVEAVHEVLHRAPMLQRFDTFAHRGRRLIAYADRPPEGRTVEGLLVPREWPPGKGLRAPPALISAAAPGNAPDPSGPAAAKGGARAAHLTDEDIEEFCKG